MPSPLFPDRLEPDDAQRQRIHDELISKVGRGELTLEDFSTLSDMLWSATTRAELATIESTYLTPSASSTPPAPTTPPVVEAPTPVPKAAPQRLVSVLTSVRRKGTWVAPNHLQVFSTVGEVRLDFTKARATAPVTYIDYYGFCSEIRITVPAGVAVDAYGFTSVLCDVKHSVDSEPYPHAPRIVIRGFGALCEVRVSDTARRKKRRW